MNKKFSKYLIIFFAGIIETFLFTWYLIAVDKGMVLTAPILMFMYMTIYLTIISFALKDINTFKMILAYALACSIGTLIRLIIK